MATTTVESATLLTPDGNIRAQLSGEDGHVTLTITSKTEHPHDFLKNIVVSVIHKPEANRAGTRIIGGRLDQVISRSRE